ncbi:SAM-dependent methyltransferase [Kribbella sp. NPDC059898]|uniref:SAM-dependent methyltransferase n=1 Tax=Kribbella sp. NPDC059898 TaxID=3346995 RepID=UPI003665D55D
MTDIGFDLSVARVWNALAGGRDNFAVDRALLAPILADVAPGLRKLPEANAGFLIRACEYLAGEAGVTQYIDCGPGLPIGAHVHDVVQKLQPTARVVYVDQDPIVLAHARALLEVNDRIAVVEGDIFDPDSLLSHPAIRDLLDFTQPIAVLQTATLHYHPGPVAELAGVMQTYVDALPSGSYTVISHFMDPEIPERTARVRQIEKHLAVNEHGSAWFRTRDEIRSLFPGQDLTEPGLEACMYWPDPDLAMRSSASTPEWTGELIAGGVGQLR